MIDIEVEAKIERPVEEVFAFVADVANDPAWNTDMLEARRIQDDPVARGTTYEFRNKPFMGVSAGTAEVVEFEPNRRHVVRADMGKMTPTITHLFGSADGVTTVRRRIEFMLPGLMRLMQPLVRMMARKRNAVFLANLKRVLEQPSSDRQVTSEELPS